MARRGFFQRVFGAIGDLFGIGEGPRRSRDDFQEAYWGSEHSLSNYDRHRATFDNIPGMDYNDEDTQLELWESYIRNMLHPAGKVNDLSNPFWSDIGMAPEDFDNDWWESWRDAYAAMAG